jgi:putative transposase
MYSMEKICRLFGMSRQANYQYFKNRVCVQREHELIVKQVQDIRRSHPRLGTRKLFYLLQPFFEDHDIKMGRDSLFNLLASAGMLVRRRQRKVNTTYSQHWLRKWPNLTRGYQLDGPNQLWVSDITYWRVSGSFLYISFVTDAYSRKIVGYNLSTQLDMVSSRHALLMALETLSEIPFNLIHHSDRGTQYCSMEYIRLLHKHGIKVSMTENGDPKENAIAERLNGIIKEEYLNRYKPKSFDQAMFLLKRSVNLYNEKRPHLSINLSTPNWAHYNKTKTFRKWKNYFRTNPVNTPQD